MHQLRMSPLRPFSRWTKIPSSLPAYIYFFHLFSTPKFPPLLPTFYLPFLPTTYLPPPTYHLPLASYLPPTNPSPPPFIAGSELGVGEGSLEQELRGELGGELRRETHAGARADPSKHLTFSFLVYFVCLFMELCCALQRRRLLLVFFLMRSSTVPPSSTRCEVALERISIVGRTRGSCSGAAPLLLRAMELRCTAAPPSSSCCGAAAPSRRRWQLPSPSSSFVLLNLFFPYTIAKKAETLYWRRRRQLPPPSSLCCKEMANLPFFCGFDAKKVTAAMSSPSSMVADIIFSLLLLMV